MSTDPPTPGCCNAKTRSDGRCQKAPINGTGRCRLHGGASTGPRDPSTLEDNDHAVGNSGGGAPPLNRNAEIHGAFGDLDLLEQRLAGDALAYVEKIRESTLDMSRDARPSLSEDRRERLAREYALLFYQWHQATVDTFERGMGLTREKTFETADGDVTAEVEVANPTLGRSSQIARRQHRIGNVLGLWDRTRGPTRPDSPTRRASRD